MAIVFATRASLTARYSGGGSLGFVSGVAGGVTVAADAGAISGNSFQWSANNSVKGVAWPGRTNTPNGRSISVLVRFRPGYTGAPATSGSIFSLTTMAGKSINVSMQHLITTGNVVMTITNELAAAVLTAQSFGAWSPTSGTWYDIVFTWDGTTTANACKVYIDAVLLGQATAANAFTASWTNQYFNEISLGSGGNQGGTLNAGRVDEYVIWDSVITPSSVTLDTGTGSLNGASRVSLVTVTAFDGAAYTDPGVANVLSTATYTYAGTVQAGTWQAASAANVKIGVTFGIGGGSTGTYDGSDRWSDPGVANVRLATAYQANSTTNNRTGTLSASCDYPAVGDVKSLVTYASGTLVGTYNPLASGIGIGSPHLTEKTRSLIISLIKTNIAAELAAIRTDRADGKYNVEVPRQYFTWDGAISYQCPALFCVVDSAEYPDERTGTNYVSAVVKVFVTVVLEGTSEEALTIQTERYQAALFKILHQTVVNDPTDNVKIYTRCKRFEFSPLYTKSRAGDNMSDFRKEVGIELEVQHWENPTA